MGQASNRRPSHKLADQLLAEAGSAVPGFGGYYPDKNDFGIAHVYMLDTSQLEEARRALEMVVGADRVARDIREVRTVQGLYSMTQLSQWYQSLTMSYIKGTFSTDLSEGDNRINFGVVDQDAKARVEAEIDRLGMPREAVGFQIDPDPIKRHSDTLDSQFGPLVGGPRIDFLASGGGTCTLGYVTDRDLERGIITNSHCSNRFGAVGGDVVSQGGRVIGEETIDADFFTGGVCMAGRRCRFSDSTFIDLDALIASSIGRIARTEVLGWKTIDHANPELRIVDDLPVPSLFDVVNKVGIGTGRTEGAVTDTCMKVADPNSDLDLLCQYKTDYASAPGDSVSPVFRITDSPSPGDVILAGVHWGTVGGVGTFSTIGNIQQDLGLSSSWDNCDPAFSC